MLDEWFPALRRKLKRLPSVTIPRFVENVSGALVAALIVWCLWQGIALLWSGCAAVGSAISGLFSTTAAQNEELDASSPSRSAATQAGLKEAERPIPEEIRGDLLPWALPHADKSIEGLSRQADEAIMQALRRCGMDSSRVQMLQTLSLELNTARREETYKLQRMQLFLTEEPRQFEKILKTGLKTAGKGLEAVLQKTGERYVLRVQTRGVLTHELFLFQAGEAFMLPPGGTPPLLSLLLLDAHGDMENIKNWLDLDIPLAFALPPEGTRAAAEIFQSGQEVLLSQPCSSSPYNPSGSKGILHSDASQEVMRRIIRQNLVLLPQASAFIPSGEIITTEKNVSQSLATAAAECGLTVIDPSSAEVAPLYDAAVQKGIASVRADTLLNDGSPSAGDIYSKLRKVAAKAQKNGHAVAMLYATPEALAAVKRWIEDRDDDVDDVIVIPLRYQPKKNK